MALGDSAGTLDSLSKLTSIPRLSPIGTDNVAHASIDVPERGVATSLDFTQHRQEG